MNKSRWFGLTVMAGMVIVVASMDGEKVCPVGELPNVKGGICNEIPRYGSERCEQYCEDQYGAETVRGKCEDGNGRASGVKECVCALRCGLGVWEGDPRYRTLDGYLFTFNQVCLHRALEFSAQIGGLPRFLIDFQNIRRRPNDVETYPHAFNLSIVDWGLNILINVDGPSMKVNGVNQSTTYEFKRTRGHVVDFVKIQPDSDKWINISTSFGLKINLHMPRADWRDALIYLARSSNFMGKVGGMLGDFDGNRLNDLAAPNQHGTAPKTFGNIDQLGRKFCIDGAPTTLPAEEQQKMEIEHKSRLDTCREHKKTTLDKLCAPLESRDGQYECLSNEERATAIANCFEDSCIALLFDGEDGAKSAADGALESFRAVCQVERYQKWL